MKPRAGASLPRPAVTFQPHELVVALLAQLQLPAVLAQQLLVAAVDLLDGLADLVGDVQRRQGPAPRLPGAPTGRARRPAPTLR